MITIHFDITLDWKHHNLWCKKDDDKYEIIQKVQVGCICIQIENHENFHTTLNTDVYRESIYMYKQNINIRKDKYVFEVSGIRYVFHTLHEFLDIQMVWPIFARSQAWFYDGEIVDKSVIERKKIEGNIDQILNTLNHERNSFID